MLSESQERMLVIVKKGYEDKVKALFDRWDLLYPIAPKPLLVTVSDHDFLRHLLAELHSRRVG
jgi:phosphoribosylformylglycinamidine (FGAM) synthase-like enzyme